MAEKDIIAIDMAINKKFDEDKAKITEHTAKLEELIKISQTDTIAPKLLDIVKANICELQNRIQKLKNNEDYNFYLTETANLLDEYKIILKTPVKTSFSGKKEKNTEDKDIIVNEYLKIASKYIVVETPPSLKRKKIECNLCNSKVFDMLDENVFVCSNCSSQQTLISYSTSYKDVTRVNLSVKYTYARNIHFRDCINQYQGKQNSTIDDVIYKDLEEQFKLHHLLGATGNRFKNITKEHIMIFLKDLNYTKHYENVNLIHHNITGIKPDDITHLEDHLMSDFDTLVNLYDECYKNITRKNFINTQYVLYQLLMRHKHPCKKEDFTILKTIDRELFHDDICRNLFEKLGWNFISTF